MIIQMSPPPLPIRVALRAAAAPRAHAGRSGGKYGGFTLLEMLIAATVVIVLTTLLLSLVQLQVIRHQVDSAERAQADLRERLVDVHAQLMQWPAARAEIGLAPDPATSRSSYVQAVEVTGSTIVLTFGRRAHPRIAGMRLGLQAISAPDGQWRWRCIDSTEHAGLSAGSRSRQIVGASNLPVRYHPKVCRDMAADA